MWFFKRKNYTYIVKDAKGKRHTFANIRKVICEREYVRFLGDGCDVIFNLNEVARVERTYRGTSIQAEGTRL